MKSRIKPLFYAMLMMSEGGLSVEKFPIELPPEREPERLPEPTKPVHGKRKLSKKQRKIQNLKKSKQ